MEYVKLWAFFKIHSFTHLYLEYIIYIDTRESHFPEKEDFNYLLVNYIFQMKLYGITILFLHKFNHE